MRRGVTLPLPALELVRLSTGIAHGLALEQLMNREKVDPRMIELAFMPLHELSRSGAPDAQRQLGLTGGPGIGGSVECTRHAGGR